MNPNLIIIEMGKLCSNEYFFLLCSYVEEGISKILCQKTNITDQTQQGVHDFTNCSVIKWLLTVQ